MIENLNLVLDIIRVDLLIPFGLYTLFYLILSFMTKSEMIQTIDTYSCKVIVYAGVLFFLLWMTLILFTYYENSESDNLAMRQRMVGKYWFGYWLQPTLYVVLTQLLRVKTVRISKVLRLVVSICFLITIELFVIVTSSFHRDYLPSSWGMHISFFDLIVGIFSKTLLFLAIVGLFYLFHKQYERYIKGIN